ncbi:mannuronate-specific alginate lyase [Pseudomonas citronellolis]|uniref:mannuronate-specific alginate lyase n=1 Tax=Pseudomonas citronellolis TaxID=53408 RepID=UPI0023E3ACDB|nr:mannuronate-specific alginate lyase [Pseudomonas citronellolis]MDF3935375.1 mannuronate-specific alginate lyase [Pseudomonas citronellolis]
MPPLTLRTLGACALLLASLAGCQNHTLKPPAGYFAAVPRADSDDSLCPAVPTPYTGELRITSKYEGSDSARATLNRDAERRYHQQIADITAMESGTSKLVTRYLRKGNENDRDCALKWLSAWARADALESTDFTHTGKSMRKWALGSLSSAYLRLKFSSSQPLAVAPQQARDIERWFGKLADQVVDDWSDLPLKQINNHSYWAAWAVMSSAVATNRRDLFDWSVGVFKVGASQVDAQGYLPNELKRRQRALSYHNYALNPLVMIATFAQANGVDLRPENGGALQRLAEQVMASVQDPSPLAARARSEQKADDLKEDGKFAWLEPYCELYTCNAQELAWRNARRPLGNYRLGGDLTEVFKHGNGG